MPLGQRLPNPVDLRVHFVGNLNGVAVGLPLMLMSNDGFPFAVTTV